MANQRAINYFAVFCVGELDLVDTSHTKGSAVVPNNYFPFLIAFLDIIKFKLCNFCLEFTDTSSWLHPSKVSQHVLLSPDHSHECMFGVWERDCSIHASKNGPIVTFYQHVLLICWYMYSFTSRM